ncbi:AraC family transcriptional regulator [Listeria sp. FSL L7-1485]|uniref:AraC family transcriptional regulator n=1 Tax=Listeria immobilis TaxID=2713502 RepID=A0A7X1C9A5_9LIST|nr:GyrI-like domain-containing protein [Listeria immobilis]MBC1482692.1 AraC family transcriptional regulator [Listeria immobilis]MBC1488975.1 AraC family transcriptional regulator [Listeria immobilis]MBC1506094.1 AraC family transcriptional regulator [Listeria immobilis]MBC1508738.1 AraC family transcriptional regulator [Listeria immobilis]MBC1516028.1 AraC family transcriptional regulator [Listeria immobilis]
MEVEIVERNAFSAIGKKRTFSVKNEGQKEKITQFWQEVNENGDAERIEELAEFATIDGILGVGLMSEEQFAKEEMDYYIAIETEQEPPKDMEKITIPASKWAIFKSIGPMPSAIQEVWQYIFSEWLPVSDYNHGPGPELEVYSEGDTSQPDYYAEVWIPVIEKK